MVPVVSSRRSTRRTGRASRSPTTGALRSSSVPGSRLRRSRRSWANRASSLPSTISRASPVPVRGRLSVRTDRILPHAAGHAAVRARLRSDRTQILGEPLKLAPKGLAFASSKPWNDARTPYAGAVGHEVMESFGADEPDGGHLHQQRIANQRLRRRVFPRLIAPGGRAEGLEGSRFSIWLWTW